MNTCKFIKGGSVFLIGLLSLIWGSEEAAANLNGTWVQHPAFAIRTNAKESQVDRIIEGNRYVYFSVRGDYFDRSKSLTYATSENVDPIQIFRYDKTLPWKDENIRPLARDCELSGSLPIALNYSADDGVLAVVYENKAIDFIFDNGTIVKSGVLNDVAVPQVGVHPYSITFDTEYPYVYVAGSYGYATVNHSTGELVEFVKLDKELAWAGRVGTNMVVFAGTVNPKSYSTSTYVFPVGKAPAKLSNPISDATNLQVLMPLSSTSFAAVAPNGNNDLSSILKVYKFIADGVTSETIATGLTVDNGAHANFRHLFRTDGYTQNIKGGYAIHSQFDIFILKRGENYSLQTMPKTPLTTNEKNSKAATLDGSKVWLYSYDSNGAQDPSPRGFYYYHVQGGNWNNKSELASPSAPTGTFASYGGWNPEYGLILRGPGSMYQVQANYNDNLCSFSNSKWEDRSYSAHSAKYSVTTTKPQGGSTPTGGAKYADTDPMNPNMIWGCSPFTGIHRMNLADYDDFLQLGGTFSEYNPHPSLYPGYFQIFDRTPAWAALNNFTNFDFDVAGNMWFARYFPEIFYSDYEEFQNSRVPLYYLTAEERTNMENIGTDRSRVPDFTGRVIDIKGVSLFHDSKLKALKAQGNENYLIISHRFYDTGVIRPVIYDHNGTPGNQADDRYVICTGIYDENGEKIDVREQFGFYEDLKTGEVWMLTSSGPFILNPSEFLNGKLVVKRIHITENLGKDIQGNLLEQICIKNIADDNIGRKWLATESGLFCLSEDAQAILAHYNTANSPLPSENVFNVVCSPEGSVFALTARGLAEFHPEGGMAPVKEGNHLTVWPSSITPDYKGYVNISGADNNSEYVVCDKEGNEIVSLGKTDTSMFQWDTTDASGNRVGAGRYNIKRKNSHENHPLIVLDK